MISINFGNHLQISFTEKKDGNFASRFGVKEAKLNRTKLLQQLSLGKKVAEMNVNHTSKVISLKKMPTNKWNSFAKTDCLLTSLDDIALFLTTGDCIPLVVYDPTNKAFGLCHIGWRNAIQNVHNIALLKLSESYGSQPKDIQILFGPAIHSCCYQWTTPPPHLFFYDWKDYVEEKNNNWNLDLLGFVEQSLIQNGVKKKNIQILNECTYHNSDKWFSHQRSKHYQDANGRIATIVTTT